MQNDTMGYPLPGPDYYRRQADICLALSRLAKDPLMAVALIANAEKFLAKATETECGDELPPHVIDGDQSDEHDIELN
jgi:hypothetical protein